MKNNNEEPKKQQKKAKKKAWELKGFPTKKCDTKKHKKCREKCMCFKEMIESLKEKQSFSLCILEIEKEYTYFWFVNPLGKK